MVDVLTHEQRKFNMSRIRGKNTGPELKLRKLLFANGIRGYRVHYNLVGKPDIVFTKNKIVIFIDGCYWHRCPFCFQEPETRKEFWIRKINSNIDRDRKVNEQLKNDGWMVLRFWEHEVKKNPNDVLKKIAEMLKDSTTHESE